MTYIAGSEIGTIVVLISVTNCARMRLRQNLLLHQVAIQSIMVIFTEELTR